MSAAYTMIEGQDVSPGVDRAGEEVHTTYQPRDSGTTSVVTMWRIRVPKSVRLKDRDYDVTAHIFLILSLTCTPKSVMGR